ncbi:MAG: DUF1673 family protein [Methanoregula sp.]|uniref:DUF1673 family protein n=1 Tax=Methanoregula sp. TaxID=2052170 RepID=UPI003D1031F0
MTTRVSEVIHGWLGWCPNARTPMRQLPVFHDNGAGSSRVQGAGIPAHTGWQERFRNQVLLWAVFFTFISIPLVWIFQAADLTRLMLCLGVVTGLGVFVFFGWWLWHSLGMLKKGATIKTGQKEYILTFLIAGAIPLGVVLLLSAMLFLISLSGALAFPAFTTGFAFIPWYVFTLILLWERKTGCVLMFDKKTRSFTAARCPQNANF